MNIVCQRDYLTQVRNAMLLHFSHRETCTVLKDINEIFASGKEYGRTEEEMCDELGLPEEFVRNLRRDSRRDRFFGRIFSHISAILAIGAFFVCILAFWNPLCWCAPVIMIPVCAWYLCGGRCLYELHGGLQNDTCAPGYGRIHFICGVAALVLTIAQQGWVIALSAPERILSSDWLRVSFLAVYYVSMVIVLVFTLFSVLMIYRLFHGDCLAAGALMRAVGTICSSFSYLIYIRSFNGPGVFPVVCALPYILSVIVSGCMMLRRNSAGAGAVL